MERSAAGGISVLGVTDHDTVAGLDEAGGRAAQLGVRLVPGIEMTAVDDGRDVHVLGYFVDPAHAGLQENLVAARAQRVERFSAMLDRLAALGVRLDRATLLADARSAGARSVGRPRLAAALVAAGHVASKAEAFDRWLATGKPGFVPREGPSPATVIRMIADAGGVSSLAHPGLLKQDRMIPALVDAGLAAIEVYHSDHPPDVRSHYLAVARKYRLAVSGGSDYHGEGTHHELLGSVSLPQEDFARLEARRRPGR